MIDLYARALIAQGKAADAAGLLEPLAKKSASWRRAWLDLAGAFRSRDLESAAAWVSKTEPAVSNDSAAERIQLAGAWYVVGREFADRDALQKARKIAEPYTADEQVAAEAWTLTASCDEGLGNFADAEREYREALEAPPRPRRHPEQPRVRAAHQGRRQGAGRGPRAFGQGDRRGARRGQLLRHARAHRVEARQRRRRRQRFQKALARDGTSLEAMIGLADVYSRSNRRDEARQQLAQIDGALRHAATARVPRETTRDGSLLAPKPS